MSIYPVSTRSIGIFFLEDTLHKLAFNRIRMPSKVVNK
ncbi:hypothetical protein QIE_2295 [Clostridioides difficile DA00062]|nr:hypothetical protein QIE_2295 [Clostridioides difficile DA00062]EQG94995.1 hypothetical protein QKM_2123 [Clostridioides difficile DA00193]EQJ90746.1 hypothetical protein QUC_2477 [Clostridioides difficile P50]